MVDIILYASHQAPGTRDVSLHRGVLVSPARSPMDRSSGDIDLCLINTTGSDAVETPKEGLDVVLTRTCDVIVPDVIPTWGGFVRQRVNRRHRNLHTDLLRGIKISASFIDEIGTRIYVWLSLGSVVEWRDPFFLREYPDVVFRLDRTPAVRGRGLATRVPDASSSSIPLGNIETTQPTSGSVSYWIRMPKGETSAVVVGFGSLGELEFILVQHTSGFPNVTVFSTGGGTVNDIRSDVKVDDGGWHHVVLVADSSEYRFWVDGVLTAVDVVSGNNDGAWIRSIAPSTLPLLETTLIASGALEFGISDVHIWDDRTLSESDVKLLYQDPDQVYVRQQVAILVEELPATIVTADIDANANPARTQPSDLDPPQDGLSGVVVHEASVAAVASPADAAITSTRIHVADIDAVVLAVDSAGVLLGDRIIPTAVTANASTATANIVAAHLLTGSIVASASTATADLNADRVVPADTSADASTATADLNADRVIPTTAAVVASAADAALTVDRVIPAAVAAQASTATADINAERLVAGSIAATASTATADLNADRVIPTVIVASASTSTTDIDAVIVAAFDADIDADANTATADLNADRVIPTTVSANASTAAVNLDADRVVPSTIAGTTATATADLTADLISKFADIDADANTATADLTGTRVIVASLQAQASTATTSLLAQNVRQSTIQAQASTATVDLDAARVRDGALASQASTATALTTQDLIHQMLVACLASTATADLSGDTSNSGVCSVEADAATAALTADRIHVADLTARAADATADLSGGSELSGNAAMMAARAMADLLGVRVIEANLAANARTATVLLFDYSRTGGAIPILLVAPHFRRVLESGFTPMPGFAPGRRVMESPHAMPIPMLAPATSG